MLTYSYRARDGEGVLISGSLLVEHREAAMAALRKKGYHPLRLEAEGRLAHFFRDGAGLGHRVSVRDKAIFSYQLATLLRAGVQLNTALKTLSRQRRNKFFASIIAQLQSDVEQSSSLSQAMAKHPRIFPPVYSAIIAAAEESGALVETLTLLDKHLRSQAAVRARVRGALIYPVFLLVVSGVVVGVLTTFVIPKFVQLFVNSDQALPLPTKILITAMDLLRNFGWVFALALVGLVSVLAAATRQERIRLWADGLLLQLPLLGPLLQKLQVATFSRTLGSLLAGGVRLVEAIHTTRRATTNRAFAQEVDRIGEAILKGSTLTKALSQQRCFSEIAIDIISVGEDAGMLPEMLREVADMCDQESESVIGSLTGMLGPAMIVLLGLIVGFVVMAILLPIFETSTLVQ